MALPLWRAVTSVCRCELFMPVPFPPQGSRPAPSVSAVAEVVTFRRALNLRTLASSATEIPIVQECYNSTNECVIVNCRICPLVGSKNRSVI
jgi:hypothetical protein